MDFLLNGIVPSVMISIITAATPLVYAALGELVVEKSGCLNLGVEGMMVMGAVSAFAVAVSTDSGFLAVMAGAVSGALMAGLYALVSLVFLANQVATGLALTIFGLGLSALIGQSFVGVSFRGIDPIFIPFLSDIPVIGTLLFGLDILIYGSIFLAFSIAYFLHKTRWGLILRAVGENHDAAHAIGYPVRLIRLMALVFGGTMAGIGGAYLSVVYTPFWAEGMTAGRGWIALALVVFAAWRPWPAFFGAYLFGGVFIVQLHAQGFGIKVPAQILAMLPYLITIAVLVWISANKGKMQGLAPACLGIGFHASK